MYIYTTVHNFFLIFHLNSGVSNHAKICYSKSTFFLDGYQLCCSLQLFVASINLMDSLSKYPRNITITTYTLAKSLRYTCISRKISFENKLLRIQMRFTEEYYGALCNASKILTCFFLVLVKYIKYICCRNLQRHSRKF